MISCGTAPHILFDYAKDCILPIYPKLLGQDAQIFMNSHKYIPRSAHREPSSHERHSNQSPKASSTLRWVAIGCFSLILGLLGMDHFRRQATAVQSSPATGNSKTDQTSSAQPKQKPAQSRPDADPIALNEELSTFFKLIETRQTGAARVRLKKYMKLHPNDGKGAFLFGLSYHREQKYGSAIPWYEKALELSPEYYLTRHFQGWALYYLGELDLARDAFDEFLKHQPDEPDSNYALGLICLDEDDLEGAEKKLKRAIELGEAKQTRDRKDLSKAHARLGEVYERQEKLPQSKTELMESVELFPDHYEAMYKLYRVLVRMGETEEAKAVHKVYLQTKERIRPGTSFPE
jgi:tetratricopeptide (TPR) repeat protein